MSKESLPQSSDWNHFWKVNQANEYARASWSKKRVLNLLQPFIREEKNILDAGCGSGFFSKYFCDHKMRVHSLDYSQEALLRAEQLTERKTILIKKDLLRDPLDREIQARFDIIFSDGLLEHFLKEDQDKILKNLKNVLSKDGVLITVVPNRWSPWQLIRPFFMPGIKEKAFTIKDLVELHTDNGFVVLQKGGVNVFPFRLSPDKLLGACFGMLLYTIAKKI